MKQTKELEKLDQDLTAFQDNIKSLEAARDLPVQETEKQTKLSTNEIRNAKDIYLKPSRTIPDRQKFNEKFRKEWEYAKEYVQFIAEHKELIGENIEAWTHPFGGVGAEFWTIPTGKPIWGPRYLAEQIQKKSYSRLIMKETVTEADGRGQYYGQLAYDSKIQRLDAYPVRDLTSRFGSKGF